MSFCMVTLQKNRMGWQEKFIHRALIGRFGNELNVTFLRNPDSSSAKIELWVVPAATKFSLVQTEPSLSIPFRITSRTLFAEEGPGSCDGYVSRGFVELLKSDVKLTGYVVDINAAKSERVMSVNYFIDFLRENSLLDKKIRHFFKKRVRSYGEYSYREYWLMPRS